MPDTDVSGTGEGTGRCLLGVVGEAVGHDAVEGDGAGHLVGGRGVVLGEGAGADGVEDAVADVGAEALMDAGTPRPAAVTDRDLLEVLEGWNGIGMGAIGARMSHALPP